MLLRCWLLALWDGTNLAVHSCTAAINAAFLSLKCEVISFHILIFLSELSFVVEEILHACCWIFHVNELSACLENGTVSEHPVTQNLRNLGMCVFFFFLWKWNDTLEVVELCSLAEAFQASWLLRILFLAHGNFHVFQLDPQALQDKDWQRTVISMNGVSTESRS